MALLLENKPEIVVLAMLRKIAFLFIMSLFAFSVRAQVDSLLVQEGTASFYGKRFHNRKTANGEVFSMDSLTAAHKRLPFGTLIRVVRKDTGAAVLVRVNDRLPLWSKRQIDLSRAAATQLDMIRDGLVPVRVEAADLDQLDLLVEYFSHMEHPVLRVRPYYRGIQAPKRELDMRLLRFRIKKI